MELKRLRILSVIAESQSIGRSARLLGVAQPAVSRHVQALESMLDVALLERGLKGVRLTSAGHTLMEQTRGLDRRLADAIHLARLTAEGRIGKLRVALGRVGVDDPRVGRAFDAVRREERGIELEVGELGSPLHTRMLLQGDADLTLGAEEVPHHRRLSRRVAFVESVQSAVVPATHPAAGRERLDASDLEGLPLLTLGGGAGWFFRPMRNALGELGFGEAAMCDSLATIYALIAAGRGWMPTVASYESRPPVGTAVRPLNGLSQELPIVIRWRRGDTSPTLARVTRILVRAFRAMSAPHAAGNASLVSGAAQAVTRMPQEAGELESEIAHRVEARHLRALEAIANEGTVADAARRLDLTQSAVSRQLGALERIIGTPLVVRSRTGAVPTAAGAVIRDAAIATLATIDEAAAAARLAACGIVRRCTIGIVPSPIASARLHDFLRRAPRELATLAIEIRELGSPQMADALKRGEVDAALMMIPDSQPPGGGLSSRWLASDPYDTVLVAADGPLARRDVLNAADFAGLPLSMVTREQNPRLHDLLLAGLRRAGIEPVLGAAYTGPRSIWRFVADGACWAIGLHSMRSDPPAGTVARSVHGFAIEGSLHLVSRRDESDVHVKALIAAI